MSRRKFLIWLFAFSMISAAQASGPGDMRIDAPAEYIIACKDGNRYITFGEGPADIRFRAKVENRELAPRLYWRFDGGVPSRVPAQGFTNRLSSGPVKFSKAGKATLYVANGGRAGDAAETDTLIISHLTFDSKILNTLNNGESVTSEVPANANLDDKGRMELETHVVIQTNPPIPNAWLGDLKSSKDGQWIVPRHVITDQVGGFSFTISKRDDGKEWEDWDLKDPAGSPTSSLLARMLRENERQKIALARRDDGITADGTAQAVDFYALDEENPQTGIVKIPAFQIATPSLSGARLSGVADVQETSLKLFYSIPTDSGWDQSIHLRLPPPVAQAIKAAGVSELTAFMWYTERNRYVLEDGQLYLRIPKPAILIHRPEPGVKFEAVTGFPKDHMLAIQVHKSDGTYMQAFDLQSRTVLWERAIQGEVPAGGRLMWFGNRTVVGVLYDRNFSEYAVIGLDRANVLKHGVTADGGQLLINAAKLMEVNPETGGRRILFCTE